MHSSEIEVDIGYFSLLIVFKAGSLTEPVDFWPVSPKDPPVSAHPQPRTGVTGVYHPDFYPHVRDLS